MKRQNATKIRWIKRFFLLFWFVCFVLKGSTVNAQTPLILEGEHTEAQSVLLKWESDSVDSLYQIHKSQSENGTFTVLASVSGQAGQISCYDYDVKPGQTYYYKVVKLVDNAIQAESNVVSVKILLPAPANVKAIKLEESEIKLTWSKVEGATGYRIYRSLQKEKGYKKIASVKKNTFTDTSVKTGKAYYYKVQACMKGNNAANSDTEQYVGVYMKPDAPQLMGSYTKKKIKLTWNKVSGADSYYLYKKNSKDKYTLLGQTKMLSYTDKKVTKGKSYEYKIVAAYEKDGKKIKSSYSNVCKVFADSIDPAKKMVALTFDDGPGRYTKEIVACLKKYNSKATFFVLGCNVDSYKSELKAADAIGCEIGNHSYDHSNLTKLSAEEIRLQISKTDKKIKNVIGKNTALMRTPGGATGNTVQSAVGKPIILWSIDTLDWKTRDRDKTVKAVMDNVKDGDIVLMHDIHEPSKEAALILIKRLKDAGYQLVTVSELAQYRGYKLKNGTIYHSLRKKK